MHRGSISSLYADIFALYHIYTRIKGKGNCFSQEITHKQSFSLDASE